MGNDMTRRTDTIESAEPDGRGSRRPNPVDIHVGSRVRLRRMLMGLSQERLAEAVGLTFQQVQKYEKGVNRMGASRLFDMSRVLRVPVQFFYDELPPYAVSGFAEEEDPNSLDDSSVMEFLATREGLELNKAFARIRDPKVRRSVVDLVRSMAGDETER